VGEIPGTEYADTQKKPVELSGESLQALPEALPFLCVDRTLAHQQPETCNRGHSRQQGPQEDGSIVVIRCFQQPHRGQWPGDGADRVHQSLKPERAPVRSRRYIGCKQRFSGRRTHAAAQPC